MDSFARGYECKNKSLDPKLSGHFEIAFPLQDHHMQKSRRNMKELYFLADIIYPK